MVRVGVQELLIERLCLLEERSTFDQPTLLGQGRAQGVEGLAKIGLIGCGRAHAIDYATFLCFLSREPA